MNPLQKPIYDQTIPDAEALENMAEGQTISVMQYQSVRGKLEMSTKTWARRKVEEAIRNHGIELANASEADAGFGLVLRYPHSEPIYIATRPGARLTLHNKFLANKQDHLTG